MEAVLQAISQSSAGARWQWTVVARHLPAASKVMGLPRGELERACDQNDHTDRDRYGAS
jgi:hypothetical protein